jgi:hypothetical protein
VSRTPAPAAFDLGEFAERRRPPLWHEQLDRRVDHIERDMKFAKKIATAIFLMVALLLVKEAVAVMKWHVQSAVPHGRDGERLAPDRIEEP